MGILEDTAHWYVKSKAKKLAKDLKPSEETKNKINSVLDTIDPDKEARNTVKETLKDFSEHPAWIVYPGAYVAKKAVDSAKELEERKKRSLSKAIKENSKGKQK